MSNKKKMKNIKTANICVVKKTWVMQSFGVKTFYINVNIDIDYLSRI